MQATKWTRAQEGSAPRDVPHCFARWLRGEDDSMAATPVAAMVESSAGISENDQLQIYLKNPTFWKNSWGFLQKLISAKNVIGARTPSVCPGTKFLQWSSGDFDLFDILMFRPCWGFGLSVSSGTCNGNSCTSVQQPTFCLVLCWLKLCDFFT